MAKEEYITTDTIAKELELAKRTVQDWCKQKKIRAFRLGKSWRILRSDFEEAKARLLKEVA